MIFDLFMLAFAVLPGVPAARAWEAATDVVVVVRDSGALPGLTEEQTRRLVLVWSARESGLRADAVGDFGRTFGALAIRRQWFDGHTSEEVLGSRKLGLALGLAVMKLGTGRCGSLRGGLSMFASGSCTGATQLVARRCRQAGGAC